MSNNNCNYEEPKTNLLLVLAVAFFTALGAGLAGSLFKPFNAFFEEDAEFVYIDSGIESSRFDIDNPKPNQPSYIYIKHISIVLKNIGDEAGVVTSIKVNGGESVEQFYASHTAIDLKLRKKQYEKSEALVCPPRTYCEISFKGDSIVKKLEISQGTDTYELEI